MLLAFDRQSRLATVASPHSMWQGRSFKTRVELAMVAHMAGDQGASVWTV